MRPTLCERYCGSEHDENPKEASPLARTPDRPGCGLLRRIPAAAIQKPDLIARCIAGVESDRPKSKLPANPFFSCVMNAQDLTSEETATEKFSANICRNT